MFNIGSGEIALIAVAALLVLGPQRLPELARGIGKFMREFRRQTDEVRGVVEREFYRMDTDAPPRGDVKLTARADAVARSDDAPESADAPLPAADDVKSQVLGGMPSAPAPDDEAPTAPPPDEKA